MEMAMMPHQSNHHTDEPTPRSAELFYKAVCYSCRYVGMDPELTRCPLCGFAIILEPGTVPEAEQAPDVSAIFDRVSVRVGAPPLPGVDGTPRKAQLLAEARRRRHESERLRAATPRPITEGSGTSVSPSRARRLLVPLVLFGAGALGLLAACVNATL
jgi:hypothetical protein